MITARGGATRELGWGQQAPVRRVDMGVSRPIGPARPAPAGEAGAGRGGQPALSGDMSRAGSKIAGSVAA